MWKPTHEQIAATAAKLLVYFEGLESREGETWAENVRIASEWLRLVHLEHPPPEDVGEFRRSLESVRAQQGSGWEELVTWARQWLLAIGD